MSEVPGPLPPPPLPRPLRNAAVGCLVLAGVIGFGAARDFATLGNLSEYAEQIESVLPDPSATPEATELNAILRAATEPQLKALRGMRQSRRMIMGALATACALVFVSAARILRPGPLPRERVRRLLGGSALIAAALRTLDGAQFTVVFRETGIAVDQLMLQNKGAEAYPDGLATFLFTGFSLGLTFLMAGGLMVASQYFRSEKVKQIVALADRA